MGLKALRKVDFDRYLEMSDQQVCDDIAVCEEDYHAVGQENIYNFCST